MSPKGPHGGLSNAGLVAGVLVAVLAGLGASVAAVAGVTEGVRAAADQLTSATVSAPPARTVTESMEILTGAVQRERHIVTRYGQGFGPMYTNAFWRVHVGDTVILRITSYDTGPAPLTGMQAMMFDRVEGTLGGTETVAGRPVRAVANDDIAHTFTVDGLGLNLPIPAAPTGGTVTVVARFVVHRAGSFVWQCYAPCGSGSGSMGGPMSTMGWMEGKVQVLP